MKISPCKLTYSAILLIFLCIGCQQPIRKEFNPIANPENNSSGNTTANSTTDSNPAGGVTGSSTGSTSGGGTTPPTPITPTGSTSYVADKTSDLQCTNQTCSLSYTKTTNTNGFNVSFTGDGSLNCTNTAIIATQYAFMATNTFAPITSTAPHAQFACKISSNTKSITLTGSDNKGFRPWTDSFSIQLGSNSNNIKYNVSVTTTITQDQTLQSGMNLKDTFSGCGLYGTILQRVYDCSKYIVNYGNMASTNSPYFVVFNPTALPTSMTADNYWFVVSCPAGTGGNVPQQTCAWLTPVITQNNPAIEPEGTANATFMYTSLNGLQKRLLFSGLMSKLSSGISGFGPGYSFLEAAGLSNEYSNSGSTLGYTALGGIISYANIYGVNNNAWFTYPSALATPFSPLCTTTGSNDQTNFLNTISGHNGAPGISWQLPSYPMLHILTQGTPVGEHGASPYCQTNGATTNECNPQGFGAVNIPGFISSDRNSPVITKLWSSSGHTVQYKLTTLYLAAWYFSAIDRTGGLSTPIYKGGLTSYGADPITPYSVRCVSPTWY